VPQTPTIVIGGVSSGVGKTTVSIGLMAALARRGLRVQPFKVGPDYIDPSYHLAATGIPSRNLDSWMVPRAGLLELFHRACRGADIAVVEGVMGIFDGYSGRDEAGSSAQIAKLLDAPVLLLMDARKMARSAGAMALGYARFDPAMRVGGFLLNGIAGETHYRTVQEAIEGTGVGPVLGYLPRDPILAQPERHLGLVPTPERSLPEGFLDRLVGLVESHFDLDRIIAIAGADRIEVAAGFRDGGTLFPPEPLPQRAVIAFARDEAFNFYYQDNLDLLEDHGARLVPFSPIHDRSIPDEVGALYLGGGFPEMHAAAISQNHAMLAEMRGAVEAGMPIHAECGGLIYLSRGVVDADGSRYPMVGALPGWCSMAGRRLSLGYLEATTLKATPLGPAGTEVRGHEFHYSHWDGQDDDSAAYQITNRTGRVEGYARGNLLASFLHLHFGANPRLAPAFVESAAAYRL
jgi:cobyrinic acid a,c-diamide synthase